jgi:tRNA-Thr(GGU) m(6)t(6)A37 methyltransferase TsaA
MLVENPNPKECTMSTSDNGNQPTYELHPIGYVHAEGGSFHLEILEPYRPALKELVCFSHVMVFWWANQQDNPEQRAVTTTQLPYAPGVEAGVFACRAPYRPNPIALTTMFMLDVDIEHGIIHLPWIDAEDGTPLLDLKPYIPVSDRIRDVRVAEWFADWPQWMEDAGEFFAKNDVNLG